MKVSVIIPTYNCALHLEQAVRSVMSQTYHDIEIIVIDDGSTDNTFDIISTLKSQDKRINLIRQKPSGKAAIARNTGLKHAKGELIAFLDCDDIYKPGKIEAQVEVFQLFSNTDLVFTDTERYDADGDKYLNNYLGEPFINSASEYLEKLNNKAYRCKKNFYNYMSTSIKAISTQGVMIRKQALDMLDEFFPADLSVGEDIDLWFRLMSRGCSAVYLDVADVIYRLNSNSLTHKQQLFLIDSIKAHERNLERGGKFFSPAENLLYRKNIAELYYSLGYVYFRKLEISNSRSAYLGALKKNRAWKVIFALLKTYIPLSLLRILVKS